MMFTYEKLYERSKKLLNFPENFYVLAHFYLFLVFVFSFLPYVFYPNTMEKVDSSLKNTEYESTLFDSRYHALLLLACGVTMPMFAEIVMDYSDINFKTWNYDSSAWMRRLRIAFSLLLPTMIEYILLSIVQNRKYLSAHYLLTIYQSYAIVGSILSSLFGHNLGHVGNSSKNFVEIHTIASLNYLAICLLLEMAQFSVPASSPGLTIFLTVLCSIAKLFTVLEIFYLCAMTYYFQWKSLIKDGKYHCPRCLATSFQIKGVFWYFVCFLILLAISGPDTYPTASSFPLWFAMSLRLLQIILTYFLGAVCSRAYKLSAQQKKEALESRLNLIGYLSHEMRSPLNTAFLGLEFINNELKKIRVNVLSEPSSRMDPNTIGSMRSMVSNQADDRRSVISLEQVDDILQTSNHVLNSCRVASTTLDDLLTADKIGDGKLVLSLVSCNPWSLIKKCTGPFTIDAHEKDIHFVVDCVDHLHPDMNWGLELEVEVDEVKVSQVIRNLLSNALKFTPANGEVTMLVEILPYDKMSSGVLETEGKPFDRVLKVSVADSGPGISPEDQKKLFGKYVQFNPGVLQKGKGSGLGLWISKTIMELHHGVLVAHSEGLGKGSTFYMELPLYHSDLPKGDATASAEEMELGLCDECKFLELRYSSLKGNRIPASSKYHRSKPAPPALSLPAVNSAKVHPFSGSDVFSDIEQDDMSVASHEERKAGGESDGARSRPPLLPTTSYRGTKVKPLSKPLGGQNSGRESIGLSSHLSSPRQLAWDNGLRILLVDDSRPNRKVLRRLLSSHGHAVSEASDGVEFIHALGFSIDEESLSTMKSGESSQSIELARRESYANPSIFDVILIDDNMPRLNGSCAVGLVRREGYSGIILGITGNSDAASVLQFKAMGADDVMFKPIDLDQLRRRIGVLLRKR